MMSNAKHLALWLLLGVVSVAGTVRCGEGRDTKYLFYQSEASGYSAALANLERLEKFVTSRTDTTIPLTYDSCTTAKNWQPWGVFKAALYRKDWFWHTTLRGISQEHYPALYTYLDDAVLQAPVIPYFYTEDGVSCFQSYAEKATLALYPSFFSDKKALSSIVLDSKSTPVGLMLPLVRHNDGFYSVYNPDAGKYERVRWRTGMQPKHYEQQIGDDAEMMREYDSAVISQEPCFSYKTSLSAMETLAGKALNPAWFGIKPSEDEIYFYPYRQGDMCEAAWWTQGEYAQSSSMPKELLTFSDLGLYTLLLLRLGFDKDHEPINHAHALWDVSNQLRAATNTQHYCDKRIVKNSWHSSALTKDMVLEACIATLLKEDVVLCEQAEALVDLASWKSFATYKNFLSQCGSDMKKGSIFRTADGANPYKRTAVQKYLPGEEQMLAYAITTNIRNLWYATLNEEVFYARTKKPIVDVATQVFLAVKNLTVYVPEWSLRLFKKAAYKKIKINDQQISFIDFWHELIARLQLPTGSRQHYLVASGGGAVLTFNQDLIEEQRLTLKHRNNGSIWNSVLAALPSRRQMHLLHDLQCTFIDSSRADWLCGPDVKL